MSLKAVIAEPNDDAVDVHLANYAFSCDELRTGFRAPAKDTDVEFVLHLTPHLAPEGCLDWALGDTLSFGANSSPEDGGEPLLGATADGATGAHTFLNLDLPLESLDSVRRARLTGTVDATGCGPRDGPSPPPPPARGQKNASLVVAGQKLPVVGAAFVAGKNGRELVIGSGEVKCIDTGGTVRDKDLISSSRAPVALVLDWPEYGDDTSRVRLSGKWMGHGETTLGGNLSASPSSAPFGAKTLMIKVGGSAKLGAYGVALDGVIVATVCREASSIPN